MMGWDDGWGAGGWLVMSLMMVMMVGLWVGLIAFVAWLVRGSRHEGPREAVGDPADGADELLAHGSPAGRSRRRSSSAGASCCTDSERRRSQWKENLSHAFTVDSPCRAERA